MFKINTSTTKKEYPNFTKFKEQMKSVHEAHTTIGVHDDAGTYSNGATVGQVALWNEFGTKNIPSRPFMRQVIYGQQNKINSWRNDLVKQVTEGKITIEKALESLGFRIRELVKNNIQSNMPPSNAPSTARAKKAEGIAPRTLMETTLLLRSIEYKVVVK